jgi:hypothetical protein
MHRLYWRSKRPTTRRGLFTAWGIALVTVAAACFGGGTAKGHPPRGVIQSTAARYAEAKLAVDSVSILRMRHPTDPHVGDGACAIVEIRTPNGATRRVVVVHQGDPPTWEAIAVSEKFGWEDFRPDSDVNCGLYNAGIRPSPS